MTSFSTSMSKTLPGSRDGALDTRASRPHSLGRLPRSRSAASRMPSHSESISIAQARRLALAGAGLLAPRRLDLPERAGARPARAPEHCHRIIEHFGYLQLDTVAVSGARTHCIVLTSRLPGSTRRSERRCSHPGRRCSSTGATKRPGCRSPCIPASRGGGSSIRRTRGGAMYSANIPRWPNPS